GSIFKADWRIPLEILKIFYSLTQLHVYHVTDIEIYQNWNFSDKAFHWFTLPIVHGAFNRLMILSFIFSPFLAIRYISLNWINNLTFFHFEKQSAKMDLYHRTDSIFSSNDYFSSIPIFLSYTFNFQLNHTCENFN